jgi:hypothetical protein
VIYILDNAESYSDHTIYFVESDHDSADEVCALLLAHEKRNGRSSDAYIVAVAERFEWRDGGARALHECIAPGDFFVAVYEGDASVKVAIDGWNGTKYEEALNRELLDSTPRRLLLSLVARWSEPLTAAEWKQRNEPYHANFAACLAGVRRALASCGHDECLASAEMAADCAAAAKGAA